MPSYFKSSRTSGPQAPSPARICVFVLLCAVSMAASAQTAPTAPAQNPAAPAPAQPQAAEKPSISLSPAVIMAKGKFGQGLTQTLTFTNQTGRDFAFELVAED